jgi:quinol monooxygenase YgiN
MTNRRTLLGAAAVATLAPAVARARQPAPMYGVMGKMKAQPGKRADLIAILLDATADMPGCRSYVVAEDLQDADAIWITEVWDDEASHKASLTLPDVRAAIARARPLIAGFDSQTITRVVGGTGL